MPPFDGDEMNMHMPQNVLSETELRHLAAIPYQIISPSSNAPIIGIYQDSMLGTYRFTRPGVEFSPREAMNILMGYSRVDVSKLVGKKSITNFDILSQITPPLTLKIKTKQYDDKVDDYATSNNVLEIYNGKYNRGQMIASTVKGVLNRICNDFGHMACSDYIDDLQQVITEYMKTSAYSVGVSDLISDRKTTEEILQVIASKKMDVQQLTDKIHLGIFENKTGNNNAIEYENQVKGILNKATDQTGAIAKKSLSADNRFLIMVASGSKGNMVNISQMISCLGQQSVDGKRVPYGFDSRTLPHFSKYDDSPSARGFVENSYISGLTAPELFFHAMGGRMGLIDTAVKSVTWETPIVLIDENGKPVYTEIGRWIDGKLDNSDNKSRVQHFDERNMELLNVNGIYVPTTCENGRVSWEEITAVTRHDPGTKLYEIKTQGGRNVTVTESKSLLIWNKEKMGFYEMLTPDIIIGDCVPVTAELCDPPVIINDIMLSDYLPKGEFVYGTDFNCAIQNMNECMQSRKKIPIGWWNSNNGNIFTLPYSKKSSLQRAMVRSNIANIKNGCVYPYHAQRVNDATIGEKFELNYDNGLFIGLFLAEGNINNSHIYITNNNENIRNFVKSWFDKQGIHWIENQRINRIGGLTTSVCGCSSVLSRFITKLVGHGAHAKYVPTEAFIANIDFAGGLLNGYFSGDGTVSKNSVEASSASKRLIEGIGMLCSRFGIFGKVFVTKMKKNNLGTVNIRPSHRISIRSQWGQRFADKVKLIDDAKQAQLSAIKWNAVHRNFNVHNNVVLDPIVEINIIGVENNPKMYDLTIPTTLNFGLANGLQVRDTSQTGYIQRRLVKGLEDLKIEYDMTVRNNMGKIVQFSYGEDSADTTRIENQSIPIVNMSVEDIYLHFDIVGMNDGEHDLIKIYTKGAATRVRKQRDEARVSCKKYVDYMLETRDLLVENVFKFKNEDSVKTPVALYNLILNVQGQLGLNANSTVDITPLEAFQMIEDKFETLKLSSFCKPTKLFEVLYYYYLSPKDLLVNKRFNKKALEILLESVHLNYKKSIVSPGEMVGVIAGQSIGEPTTQMSLTRNECVKLLKVEKNNSAVIISTKIGDFCDQIIEENPELTFNTGHENSVETVLGSTDVEYYVMSVGENETTKWSKISHVSRHPVNGELMRVKTKSGRMVETTTSHSHLIRQNNKVQPIIGKDMKVGMRIPVSKNIRNAYVNETIKIGENVFSLDELFGWFIGAYLAEGSINYNTISLSGANIHNAIAFAARFGKECEIYENNSIQFTCEELADLLRNMNVVPDFAFVAPDKFKAMLIQAYMDSNANLHATSSSLQLIKDIALLINYFGIFGSIHTTMNICGSESHHLSISAKYAELYKERIGTLSITKLDTLNKLVEEDAHSLSDEIDKIDGLGYIIDHCAKILELEGQSINQDASIGRRTLQKYIETFESSAWSFAIVEELQILKYAATSDVIWDEILEIDVWTPEQSEFVYDFTVPENQTFLTDYGVYVHNTLNSVTYETEIIVRNNKGIVKKVQIGDFTKEYVEKATKKEYYADKDTTYAELDEYYEIPSSNEDGECSWDRIEAVTKHPVVNKDGTNYMLKITTKELREVVVTKAKSLLKLVNGKIIGVDGDALKVGDYIPVSKKTLDFQEVEMLSLKTILPPTKYIFSSEVEKAKSVMNEHNSKLFTIPYNRSDSFVSKMNLDKIKKGCKTKTEIKMGCVYTKHTSMNSYMIPEEIELNYNFGYLIGAYTAEGCMTKTQISIANNDSEYFKPILELCEQWNITTKIYTHENKGEQDLRIYNTLLCRVLEILCGKLSHDKFVSDVIAYSNQDCIRGFLDAYIGGDGTISKKGHAIIMNSVSKQLLIDVQQMMNLLGVYSFMSKSVKSETNNRGSKNIKQCFQLNVVNGQAHKLAGMLNMKTAIKQKTCVDYILGHKYKYEYCRHALTVPNEINGEIVVEDRDGRYQDVLFDRIISIEEVQNTTPYAYDLTVANTRNFNLHNGICARDTFHLAGVASKSNVTRGVPRIEEILRLTRNPDKPSVTVYLRPQDQHDKDKATNYCNMIQHTKLVDVVKSVEICFDPNDHATKIHSDQSLIDQFYMFDKLANDCAEIYAINAQPARSKWIVRMEIDAESLLEKNITMDDIHFAISNTHGSEVSCVYSDMNSSNLVFRIRLNSSVFNRGKKKNTNVYSESLDQSDEIYLLKNFQDTVLNNIVLRGINKITNVNPRIVKDMVIKEDGKYLRKEAWVLDTIGSNLMDMFTVDFIDYTRTYSNDIREMYNVLGIEAARQNILNELVDVMEASDAYVNYHHLSILCDRMTVSKDLVPIYRSGILNDDIGPIAKSTYEMHTEMFLQASRHGEFDQMRGVSANVMCGQPGYYGTNAFSLLLDMEAVMNMDERDVDRKDINDRIDELFGAIGKPDECSINKIRLDNNVHNLKVKDSGICGDDGYELF